VIILCTYQKAMKTAPDKNWPVLMFLHGNGERGNGKDELDFSMVHGPLMEAWVQKETFLLLSLIHSYICLVLILLEFLI